MSPDIIGSIAPGGSILSLRAIDKSYGSVHAIRQISLEIPQGCIYGFLGPNGAGKTTTLRCIMSIILPDSGEILFAGQPLTGAVRDRIGYLPEERGLYRKMKCLDQLIYLAQLKGMPRAAARERSLVWLERLGLADWSKRKVDELSKGMQQKIQFAATFIFGPELVILDEPFSGLDPLNIALLREIILDEKKRGTTILFSTHMLAEAEKICDAICLIEGSEKILDGTLDQVRSEFPLESVAVAYADGSEPPADLPGVMHCKFEDAVWRLTLDTGADPRLLLAPLQASGPLSLFSANRPSLNDIFLAAVYRRRGEVSATAPAAAAESGGEPA
ncbi:MAG: ATP-binding cassette domain-containing protein [bacterium]